MMARTIVVGRSAEADMSTTVFLLEVLVQAALVVPPDREGDGAVPADAMAWWPGPPAHPAGWYAGIEVSALLDGPAWFVLEEAGGAVG